MRSLQPRFLILALVCAVMAAGLALRLRYEVIALEPPDAVTLRRLVLSSSISTFLKAHEAGMGYMEAELARLENKANVTEEEEAVIASVRARVLDEESGKLPRLFDLERRLGSTNEAMNEALARDRAWLIADPLTAPLLRVKDRRSGAVSLHIPGHITIWGQTLPRCCGLLQTLLAPFTPTCHEVVDHVKRDSPVPMCGVRDHSSEEMIHSSLTRLRHELLQRLVDQDPVAKGDGALAGMLTVWEESAVKALKKLAQTPSLQPDNAAEGSDTLPGEEKIRQLVRSLRPKLPSPPDVAEAMRQMQAELESPKTSRDRKAQLKGLISSYNQWLEHRKH